MSFGDGYHAERSEAPVSLGRDASLNMTELDCAVLLVYRSWHADPSLHSGCQPVSPNVYVRMRKIAYQESSVLSVANAAPFAWRIAPL